MKLKKSFYHSRIVLPFWFISLAVVTIFKPSVGYKVLKAYVIHDEEIIRRRIKKRNEARNR